MLPNLFRIPNKTISSWILLGATVLLGFQNCAPSDKKFTVNKLDQGSNVMNVAVNVTEHPIEIKTITTDYTLQLSDRSYLAGVLSDVFGPAGTAAIRQNITLKPDDLGGPCSEYAQYKIFNGTDYVDKDPGMICNEDNTTNVLMPPATAVRQGWVIQTCSILAGKEADPQTLNYVLGKIKSGSSLTNLPLPTAENMTSLHKLFYRERPLPPESVFEALQLMFHTQAPTVDDWKTAINSYCISSQWQVL